MQQKSALFIVTKNYPPEICGVGDYAQQLNQRLQLLGYHSIIVTSHKGFEKKNKEKFILLKKWNLKVILEIFKKSRANKSTVLLQYVPYTYSKIGLPLYLLFFVFFCRISGIKVVTYFHEVANRLNVIQWKLFPLSLAQRILAYLLFFLSNASATSNKLYQSYFKPFSIQLIPIPSNFEEEECNKNNNYTDKEQPFILVGFINRCSEAIIKAVASLYHDHKIKFHFYIIGKDHTNNQHAINKYIKKYEVESMTTCNINLTAEELITVVNKASIFLQNEKINLRNEGGASTKNGTIALAMSLGKIILTTNGDMTDDSVFINNYNVLFAKYDDAKDWLEKIKFVFENQKLYNNLAKNARQTYQSKMSWKFMESWYLKQLKEC